MLRTSWSRIKREKGRSRSMRAKEGPERGEREREGKDWGKQQRVGQTRHTHTHTSSQRYNKLEPCYRALSPLITRCSASFLARFSQTFPPRRVDWPTASSGCTTRLLTASCLPWLSVSSGLERQLGDKDGAGSLGKEGLGLGQGARVIVLGISHCFATERRV
jgi:hypothetical protein